MYWRHWGDAAALPFRLLNLDSLFEAARQVGLEPSLTGRSARHILSVGALGSDHDDDVSFRPDLKVVYRSLREEVSKAGFRTIRHTDKIWSIERFDRYIDIHCSGSAVTVGARGHGRQWTVEEPVVPAEPVGRGERPKGNRVAALRQIYRSPVASGINFLERYRGATSKGYTTGPISLSEFLDMKFDFDNAINWELRKNHVCNFAWAGATIRDILSAISTARLLESLVETPMTETFPEPINLARDFWASGNNFFVAPILSGFRHGVLPYSAANLYIRHIEAPMLYSLDYYNSLPPVAEDELEQYLAAHPIAVKKNSVRSGRHRVAAMIGRLARGEEYFPFVAETE